MSYERSTTAPTPGDVLQVLSKYRWRWLIPTAAVTLLGVLYAFFGPRQWDALQSLIVRNDAASESRSPGEFVHDDAMKVTQETILEVLKSSRVVTAALKEVGPPADYQDVEAWPTYDDLSALRGVLKLSAPNGAEFGETEVFYLHVRAESPDRARQLAVALTRQVQQRFQELRDERAQSLITELVRRADIVREQLNSATSRLELLENSLGSDLAELRSLHGSPSSQSELRAQNIEMEKELRAVEEARSVNRELLALLNDAQDDPTILLATPNRLLESQPALRRLKDGLIDAQIATAKLRGQMTEEHPKVRGALGAEEEIRRHIHQELAMAIRGLEVELHLNEQRIAALQGNLADTNRRLERVASLRAEYTNLVGEVDDHSSVLAATVRNLSEARAIQVSAQAASLIATIDEPEVGHRPTGPRKAVVILAGLVGGFAVGMAVLFLTVPSFGPGSGSQRVAADTAFTQPVESPNAGVSLQGAPEHQVVGTHVVQ